MRKARGSADITQLASPVTRGGIGVTRGGQLLLLARAQGHQDPQAWARYALSLLAAHGAAGSPKDGKIGAEDLSQLSQRTREFAAEELPILLALQVVGGSA